MSLVVDRHSIRRRRKKRRLQVTTRRRKEGAGNIKCLGFDGKKDNGTKVIREREMDGQVVTRYGTESEEYYVFVQDPPGKYLDHMEVNEGEGTGRCLGAAISEFVTDYISQDSLEAVACDGTKTNTG